MAGSFRITGVEANAKALADAAERAKNLEPALRVTAERIKSLIDESFATSTAPDGTAWDALAPRTLARKAKQGYSDKPLIRRGARGLQGGTSVEAKPLTIQMRVREAYGVYHQSDAARSGRLPRRAFLPVDGFGAGKLRLMGGARVDAIVADLKVRVAKWVARGER